MLSLIGLLLEETNFKNLAMKALAAMPPKRLTSVSKGYLEIRTSWLFVATEVFLNVAVWVLFAVIGYLLFWWRDHLGEENPEQ